MILVTGASEGIGYACARLLLERSDGPVLITGRSEAKLIRFAFAFEQATHARRPPKFHPTADLGG